MHKCYLPLTSMKINQKHTHTRTDAHATTLIQNMKSPSLATNKKWSHLATNK